MCTNTVFIFIILVLMSRSHNKYIVVAKVLMAYNKNVTMIEFHVAPGIDADLVTSSIQRKLEAWSGVACPLFSRFAMAPFTLFTMETERHRRSAEMSVPRNKVKSRIYNWELEWLDKMF